MPFGDCVHNLRSALDHLVYQRALLHSGRELTDEEALCTSFPICSKPLKLDALSGIGLLRERDAARIREVQPYNALNQEIWGAEAGFPFVPIRVSPCCTTEQARTLVIQPRGRKVDK